MPVDAPQKAQAKGRVSTQGLACFASALAILSASSAYGWTALTLPSIEADPELVLGTAEVAWIGSIISLSSTAGSIFAGALTDWLGRRILLMVTAPFLSAGWLTISFAPNAKIILLGRFICGATTAFIFSAGPVYCSEVTEARLRGTLGLLSSVFIAAGITMSYLAGAFFSWRITCYICLSPTILMLAVLWVVPESPYWYLLKGREEDCKASIRWLRGPDYDSAADIGEMKVKIDSVGKKVDYRELWRPRTRKPLLITLFLSSLTQICGGTILIVLTGTIFISAGVEDHRMATIIAGLVQVVFTALCALTADRIGRRPLIICSSFITSIATTFLGLCYFVNDVLEIHWPPWAAEVSVLVAVAGSSLGCLTLPLLLSAELFNTTIRSTTSAVNLLFARLLSFAVLQIYPFFEEAFGAHSVFFTLGGMGLLCSFVTCFVVPETKGKTLEQIQEYFESSKRPKRNMVQPKGDVLE